MKYQADIIYELVVPVEFESRNFVWSKLSVEAKEVAQSLINELGFEFFATDTGHFTNLKEVENES